MANSQNFRSAFNGFNREDVVHYLEYLNSKHNNLVNQLSEEAENLRQKVSMAAEAVAFDSARAERIVALESEKEELLARLAESEAAQERLEAENAELRRALDAKQTAAPLQSTSIEMELEAYRRAERAERIARERADQLYRQTNGVLAEASVQVDKVAADIGIIADQVSQQLQLLQTAVTGSKDALKAASSLLYTIRPEGENI